MVEDDPVSVVVLPSTPTAPASSSHVPTSNNVPVSYDITAYNSTPPALDEEELQMEEWGDWNTTSSQPPQTTVYSSRAPEAKECELNHYMINMKKLLLGSFLSCYFALTWHKLAHQNYYFKNIHS